MIPTGLVNIIAKTQDDMMIKGIMNANLNIKNHPVRSPFQVLQGYNLTLQFY